MHIVLETKEEQPPMRGGARPRAAGVNLVVLAADVALVDQLREALAGTHRVWRADGAVHAADLVVAAGQSALLIDSGLADHDTGTLVSKLHEQFPDLPIIVAGRRDDEAELAPLVSSGAIFRFLHKPASVERIRTFVDATQRRSDKRVGDLPAASRSPAAPAMPKITLPKVRLDPALVQRFARTGLVLVAVLGIAVLLATWKPWQALDSLFDSQDSGPIAPVDAGRDPAVLKLLDAAGIALTQGRLVDPPGQNAIELYRAALTRDPGNKMARQGLERVADQLLEAGEEAMLAGDLAGLAGAIDAARSARPDHPRLEFFSGQLQRERERAEAERRRLPEGAAVVQNHDANAARSAAGRVNGLVLLANERMASNRLVGGSDSAHAYLQAARRLDPADPGVRLGISTLSARLQLQVREALSAGRINDATSLLHQVVALDLDSAQVAALRAEVESARLGNVREQRARLLALANLRIAQGRLLEPTADSARHYVDLLRASDPAYPGLSETSELLASRALEEGRRRAASGDAAGARRLLSVASGAGAPRAETDKLLASLEAATKPAAAPKPAAVIAESELRRTRYVAPRYPERALSRGISGWVDLHYTVRKDGSTANIQVVAEQPASTFDRAAIDAIERWRYEPRMVSGQAVDQRVVARVRFELAD